VAKIDFYNIEKADKVAIFTEIATQSGIRPFAVEKDWWVSRILEIIFQMPVAEHIVFKGGTSLSKAWKLINRFSEDIDLAIDKEFFEGYSGNISKTQIGKLRKEAGAYTSGTFFEDLKQALISNGFIGLDCVVIEAEDSDQDPRILEIYYPNVIKADSEYLLPRVQIEIGCRSLREPFSLQSFGALVDEFYAGKDFAKPLFKVPTVNPERTFLEKLFLLQEEFHRPAEKIRVNRLSRHLYDIFHLAKAGIAEKAFMDNELYENIVTHRYKFSKVGGVDYNLHSPKYLNPIPPKDVISDWETDYTKMKEEMIYEENKPSFNDLINNLNELCEQLRSVDWKFGLKFIRPNSL
jgi:hypothetical protein